MTYLTHSRTFPNKKWPMPSWILCCLAAASIMTCVSIIIGWSLRVSDLEGSFPRPPATRSILFELGLISLDPLQNVVTVDWRIIGDDCIGSTAGNSTQIPACPVVDIYVNPNQFLSLGGSSPQNPPSDNDAASQPTFRHNATAFALNGPSALPVFRTQLDTRPHPLQARADLVDYPFDKYTASASISAQTDDTGQAVGVWIYNVTGAVFGFTATLGGTKADAHPVESVNLFFKRALSAKLYVISIILGMWLISLAQMAAMIKAVFFRHRIETAVLILPVATMIAFAQLRGSFPNAPVGFGANIDVIGSLPTYVCLVFTVSHGYFLASMYG
ncbi:hypothetical protein BJV78DRAFT_542229 [Lactifluus subvellereus]|nr:hypothetical protein BJV78DRAFT_542229 [Lactifluus subvellereus]